MFFYEFCKIFENICFVKLLQTAASEAGMLFEITLQQDHYYVTN